MSAVSTTPKKGNASNQFSNKGLLVITSGFSAASINGIITKSVNITNPSTAAWTMTVLSFLIAYLAIWASTPSESKNARLRDNFLWRSAGAGVMVTMMGIMASHVHSNKLHNDEEVAARPLISSSAVETLPSQRTMAEKFCQGYEGGDIIGIEDGGSKYRLQCP